MASPEVPAPMATDTPAETKETLPENVQNHSVQGSPKAPPLKQTLSNGNADTTTNKGASEDKDKETVVAPPPSSSSSDDGPEPKPEEKKEEAPKRSTWSIALIMLSLCLAVFLAALDTTIVTTAVPTITEHFKASEANYTWIGSAYLLAAAASVPTWGKFSDIWGRKPILLLANGVFFVGSLISALAINIKMLLAGRVIQGTGGGGLIVLANICISDLFSMRDRGKYFGIVGATWGIASACGPVLGGVFTQKVSWRWCFYINLPFDGLAFIIILFLLDIDIPKTSIVEGLKAIDWGGVVTISGGTVMFLLGLEYGGVSYPWDSATVICLIVFGLFTIGLFFINEWKFAKYPVMPLRIFKYRSNIACLLVCFTHGFVFMAGGYFLPLYFQSALGATPILSGVYLFPFILALSFVSLLGGIFVKKTGQYLPPIWFGMFFMTLGFGLFIDFPAGRGWGRIIPYQLIAGIGVGPNFQSPLIALQARIAPRDIATATATFGFVRNLSTAISVVIGGVIFQNRMKAHQDALVAAAGPELGYALANGGAGAATKMVQRLPQSEKQTVAGIYTSSLQAIWIFYAVIAGVGLAFSLMIGKQKLSKVHEIQKTGLAVEKEHREEEKRKSQLRKSGEVPKMPLNEDEKLKDEESANARS